jgi:hypothetical protein
MKRVSFVALALAMAVNVQAVAAEEYRPLDQIVNFKSLGPDYRSLLDPTMRANVASFDAIAQEADTAAPMLAQERSRHVVRAGRFIKIPDDMTAGDVIRAWRQAGGNPTVRPPAEGTLYWDAEDEGHSVSDVFVGTGFVCAKPGTPGVLHAEIWARRFLFVTAEGRLVAGEPPKCE